ncbi:MULTISPECIES: PaaI family thioesterase [Thermomonospora]|uniref:Acyl-coenzyme A thioesterase THEM4 n=1 Tax=Thermomonospora curvata (strain ATCC 19995 / DSM 43183 / JCM 3096 / KCTC 9072 / NBRC 15933 / NCIMB 10081 / Henssen B9) TaxID=471852 RepID=D1AAI9_THECD|nr:MULTISPECIES: hotdog domain-containing protein [Thermomonospora]ACY98902.1 thioesterase superfamily protein [Thermomonospora curvata DSM 43183]PKK13103.1 MAG: thioesterase [Thermomonospora sp. CIF 1]
MTEVEAAGGRTIGRLEDRRWIGEERAAQLAELAARVRELTEAVVLTEVDSAEIAAVAEQVAALTARLNAARDQYPPMAAEGTNGMVRQLASPVTGRINPIAPPVTVTVCEGGVVRGEFTLNTVYEGPPGFVHGGVTALVLDQMLGLAAASGGVPGLTATLDMCYRRPTPYGVPLTVEARVTRTEGRKTFAEAHVLAPGGKVTVEATAMFVRPLFQLPQGTGASERN